MRPQDEPIAFIECNREADTLAELRLQREQKVGMGGDMSGILEVRFQGESSTGSAVLREWFDHSAQYAFLNAARPLAIASP